MGVVEPRWARDMVAARQGKGGQAGGKDRSRECLEGVRRVNRAVGYGDLLASA
jgi:hypothetical protein